MAKEKFIEQGNLTLFCGCDRTIHEDTYDLLPGEHITLSDTVIPPDGWAAFSLSAGFVRLAADACVRLSFGKPDLCAGTDAGVCRVCLSRTSVSFARDGEEHRAAVSLPEDAVFALECRAGQLTVVAGGETALSFPLSAPLPDGYLDLSVTGAMASLCAFAAEAHVEIPVLGLTLNDTFQPFEIKTYKIEGGCIAECDILEGAVPLEL